MKTEKIIALFLSATFVCMVFNGCQKKPSDKKYTKTTSITCATSFGSEDFSSNDYGKLRREFTSKNKIDVIDKSTKADDRWKSEIRIAFESGNQPDVMYFFGKTDVSSIIQKNQVVSIDEIRAVYPDYAANISPNAFYDMREPNEKTYAVPIMRFWEGLYCNEELFKKYDVKPITDWKSLLDAIDKFKANGITPIAASFSDVPNYLIEHSIASASGTKDFAVNPKTQAELPKSWENGLNLLKELYTRGAFSPESFTIQQHVAITSFNNEKAAMIFEGSWLELSPEMLKKARVVPMPASNYITQDQQMSISGIGSGWYISRDAWNDKTKRDACVKYVKHMSSDDAVSRLCRGNLPTTINEIDLVVDLSPQITTDAYNMLKSTKTDMPIDSRLSKGAWEYLIQKIPAILSSETTAGEVLKKIVELN